MFPPIAKLGCLYDKRFTGFVAAGCVISVAGDSCAPVGKFCCWAGGMPLSRWGRITQPLLWLGIAILIVAAFLSLKTKFRSGPHPGLDASQPGCPGFTKPEFTKNWFLQPNGYGAACRFRAFALSKRGSHDEISHLAGRGESPMEHLHPSVRSGHRKKPAVKIWRAGLRFGRRDRIATFHRDLTAAVNLLVLPMMRLSLFSKPSRIPRPWIRFRKFSRRLWINLPRDTGDEYQMLSYFADTAGKRRGFEKPCCQASANAGDFSTGAGPGVCRFRTR